MIGALMATVLAATLVASPPMDERVELTVGGLKNGTMELVMIPAGEPTVAGSCLDGSPFGMYQLLNESSPNWIIYFDGGKHPTCCWLLLELPAWAAACNSTR